VSYWFGIIATYALTKRYTGALELGKISSFYLKIGCASLIAVASVAFAVQQLDPQGNVLTLVGVLLSTSLIYILVARAMKIAEVGQTIKVLLRR
jgi:hypothetical protein